MEKLLLWFHHNNHNQPGRPRTKDNPNHVKWTMPFAMHIHVRFSHIIDIQLRLTCHTSFILPVAHFLLLRKGVLTLSLSWLNYIPDVSICQSSMQSTIHVGTTFILIISTDNKTVTSCSLKSAKHLKCSFVEPQVSSNNQPAAPRSFPTQTNYATEIHVV